MVLDLTKVVKTVDGRAVKIIYTEGPGAYPVIGLVEGYTSPVTWSRDGKYDIAPAHDSGLDLVNDGVSRTGWVNLTRSTSGAVGCSTHVYATEKEALSYSGIPDYVATVMIEWKECKPCE